MLVFSYGGMRIRLQFRYGHVVLLDRDARFVYFHKTRKSAMQIPKYPPLDYGARAGRLCGRKRPNTKYHNPD